MMNHRTFALVVFFSAVWFALFTFYVESCS